MYLKLYTAPDSCQHLITYYCLLFTVYSLPIIVTITGWETHKKEKAIAQSLWAAPDSLWFTGKWARQDSNLRPTGYEPAALPLSYKPILFAMKNFGFHGNQICVERETGFEPATPCLEGRNSTTELLPRDRIYFTSNLMAGKQEKRKLLDNLILRSLHKS